MKTCFIPAETIDPAMHRITPAIRVAKHHFVYGRRTMNVAGAEGHVGHCIDQRNDVVLLDVKVNDGAAEKFFFRRHVKSNFINPCLSPRGRPDNFL